MEALKQELADLLEEVTQKDVHLGTVLKLLVAYVEASLANVPPANPAETAPQQKGAKK